MLTCGSFFSGIGLLDFGLHLAGLEHRWGCESDEWRRELWEQRFRAECHPDIRAFDAGWGRVDVVAGGFPCKGASTAGPRTGFGHPETVLWREMRGAIGELGPRYVLIENVANILALHGGAVWGEVLADLDALGFDVVWDCLPAAAVGAPHRRDRVIAIAALTQSTNGQGSRRGRPALGRVEADAVGVTADAAGEPERDADHEADPIAGGRYPRPLPDLRAPKPAPVEDTHSGASQPAGGERGGESQGTPVAVDWAEYGPAIARWERVLRRPAGEPLLSGVVARGARRLVRSRLSALGDGVQVQVGYLAGCHIVELERQRLMGREAA